MALQNYTNRTGKLGSTSRTTAYTVPDQKMAIVQTGTVMNNSGDTPTLTIEFANSGGTNFTFVNTDSFSAYQNKLMLSRPFFLDEKEKINFTASAADKFEYILSIAEVDQGVNNKYISKRVDMDSTAKTTVYTVPDNRTAIIVDLSSVNYSGTNTGNNSLVLTNASGTDFLWEFGTWVASTTYRHIARSYVLQEKEALKFTVAVADRLNIFASFLEMERAGGSASE